MPTERLTIDLQNYFDNVLGDVGEVAKQAITEEVAIFSNNFFQEVKQNTPVDTNNLRDSLKITNISSDRNIGFNIEFVGNHRKNNQSNAKIANVINFGTPNRTGTRFVSRAIRKLKRLNPAIDANYEQKIQVLSRRG